MESFIAGIDIGGSHITVALIDVAQRAIVEQTKRRMLVNAQEDAAYIIASWAKVIRESFEVLDITPTRLGIAMPGPFAYGDGISLMKDQGKYDALYGLNVKKMLAAQLQLDPENISFANDAACFLQGEVFSGAAKTMEPVLGLTLGTGLGAARAVDGRAEDANLWCAPFKDGIAEDYLSSRWFVGRYYELTNKKLNNVKEILSDGPVNPYRSQVFNEFGANLGDFLTPLLREEGISRVVLGGSIANSFSLFFPALHQRLQQDSLAADVVKSCLGENATMLGAASYNLQQEVLQSKIS